MCISGRVRDVTLSYAGGNITQTVNNSYFGDAGRATTSSAEADLRNLTKKDSNVLRVLCLIVAFYGPVPVTPEQISCALSLLSQQVSSILDNIAHCLNEKSRFVDSDDIIGSARTHFAKEIGLTCLHGLMEAHEHLACWCLKFGSLTVKKYARKPLVCIFHSFVIRVLVISHMQGGAGHIMYLKRYHLPDSSKRSRGRKSPFPVSHASSLKMC
jgi:hypothetical protein